MVGVGIIGMGSISLQHVKAYKAFPECCRIYGIYDRHREKAEEKQRALNLEADIYTDYREILKDSRIQLVSICLPPFLHREIAVASMLAGKDVLVEKPMAPSLEECDEMLEIQKKTGRYLGVVSQNRYTKDNAFLREMMKTGRLGTLLWGEAASCWYRGNGYYALKWRGSWELEGGGCLLNHGVHQIDLLNWILGKPREVYGVTANLNHRESQVEDQAAVILKYPQGAVVTLTITLNAHEERQEIHLEGSRAGIRVPFSLSCKFQREDGFPLENQEEREALEKEYEAVKAPGHEPFAEQIEEVLRSVETGKCLGVTGDEGRDSVEVITAVYASAVSGKPVKLPIGRDSYFYKGKDRIKLLKGEEKENV